MTHKQVKPPELSGLEVQRANVDMLLSSLSLARRSCGNLRRIPSRITIPVSLFVRARSF